MKDILMAGRNLVQRLRGVGVEERWVWFYKSNTSDPCGVGTSQYLDCGSEYMNLYRCLQVTKPWRTSYTHAHTSEYN